MHLVDGLVERTVVQAAVEPVVPGILHGEDDGDLYSHFPQRRERNAVVHTKVCGDGVEEPNLGQLSREVADEDDGSTVPLLLERRNLLVLNLVLVEIGDLVGDNERQASTEVDNLVHDKAHDTGGERVVLHK